jgi:uncharacterized protein YjbJ (UPF0337 family)
MNKDQAKGVIKETAGKVQTRIGQAVGSSVQQAKGVSKQVEGQIQKKLGDSKQAAKALIDKG